MPHGNAPEPCLNRRHLLLALLLAALPLHARAQEKKKADPNKPVERPPVLNPLLTVEAVTAPVAPVAGKPPGTIIMTFTLDCGTTENAQAVDNMMPRVYNAVILELNREPLGQNGRFTDQDLEAMKRRLLYQINRALRGPTVNAVLIRSLQEVPRRG